MSETSSATPRETLPVRTTSITSGGSRVGDALRERSQLFASAHQPE